MKKLSVFLASCAVAMMMTSCSPMLVSGFAYTKTTTPMSVTSNSVGSKVGTAEVKSYVGVVALGDAGVNAAAKNGGITKISHVDVETFSILGVYTVQKYIVYGE